MKSCLGLIVATVILLGTIATGLGVWYLSHTTELGRKKAPAKVETPTKVDR